MPGNCHRCEEPVFAAEEKRAMNHSWHADCFSCATCGQSLDSVRLEENRDLDDIYCTACYKRLFATVSYGQSRQGFLAVRMNCNCCSEQELNRSHCFNRLNLELKEKLRGPAPYLSKTKSSFQ